MNINGVRTILSCQRKYQLIIFPGIGNNYSFLLSVIEIAQFHNGSQASLAGSG